MAEYVEYGGHRVIVGPGLDEVLEPGYRVLMVDEEYAGVYEDYVFLGYEVFEETLDPHRPDLVGAYAVSAIMSRGPTVVVCGASPLRCLSVLSSYMVYEGSRPREAVERASRLVARLYGVDASPTRPFLAALRALRRLLGVAGREGVATIMGLASSYEYGRGRAHYGEAVTWADSLGGGDAHLLAAALHFLTEGQGGRLELLRHRLEAVGVEALEEAVGGPVGEALELLRGFARGSRGEGARFLELVEGLSPGDGSVDYVEAVEGSVVVHCRRGGYGEPERACVEAVSRVAGLLPLEGLGLRSIRLASPG